MNEKRSMYTVKSQVLTRVYNSEVNFFAKRLQYISIKNSLHRHFEKVCMYFKTRHVRTGDATVCMIDES